MTARIRVSGNSRKILLTSSEGMMQNVWQMENQRLNPRKVEQYSSKAEILTCVFVKDKVLLPRICFVLSETVTATFCTNRRDSFQQYHCLQ
jgi:hypothetical protein